MEVTKTLKARARGIKGDVEHYGDRLGCVRYRHDKARKVRMLSVEIIVNGASLPSGYILAVRSMYPHHLTRLCTCRSDICRWISRSLRSSLEDSGRGTAIAVAKAIELRLKERIVAVEEDEGDGR